MLIAFTGQKRSGKDTVANMVLGFDESFDSIRFAGPLKEMIATLLAEMGMEDDEIEDHIEGSKKEVPLKLLQGQSVRYAMQKLGTEWRNFFGPNLWTDIITERLDALDNALITDLRFKHEAAFVRDRKGTVCRVLRYGQPPISADAHASEREMAEIEADTTIYNYGSLEDLEVAAVLSFSLWMYYGDFSAVLADADQIIGE